MIGIDQSARPDQRRDLVAQALAATGRQSGERAASTQNLADPPGLQAVEVDVTEGVARGVERIAAHGWE